MMEIGLKCSCNKGLSILWMGIIPAFFQAFGKYDFRIQLLIIAVRGLAIISATNLTNLTGNLTYWRFVVVGSGHICVCCVC